MRARFEAIWRSGRWVEALALIAGAVVVVAVVAALRDSGRSHGRGPLGDARPRGRVPAPSADSPNGAERAATTYLGLLAETAVSEGNGARAEVAAMTTGPLRAELAQGLPVLTRALRARLASTGAPAAFEGWPLGYRVTNFTATRATVSIWHLDLAASSTLGLMTTDYATTTYDVLWVTGTWRIAHARYVPGPTPPPASAPLQAVDRFAAAVREFSGYRYAP